MVFINTLYGQTPDIAHPKPNVQIYDITDSFSWIQKGKMFSIRISMPINRHVLKCYHSLVGDDIILSRGIDGLNVVLKNEVSKERAKEFLHDHCAGFLLSTMTFTPSLFVSIEYDSTGCIIKNDRGRNNKPAVIKDNDWTLQFGVATTRGGIEHWHVSGQVSPLRIIDFNRKIILPDGTLDPIITTTSK